MAEDLEATCGTRPAWILLDPASAHQKLWQPGARKLIRLIRAEAISAALQGVPTGGQGATSRADWVRKIAAEVPAAVQSQSETFILPVIERSEVTALIGWSLPGLTDALSRLVACVPVVRAQFRKARALEKARTEGEALRWLLARSDRLCAVARPDGELLGASLTARDFLQVLRFGQRHFFRTDEPELPSSLARSVGQLDAGQVLLNESCTARFERLALPGGAWMPVLGIEFFSESSVPQGLPLSLLTAVERDIYCQIVAGATNAEIARRRGTAFSTVKNQISHLLDKLGVSRRIELLSPPSGIQFLQANSAREGGAITVTR